MQDQQPSPSKLTTAAVAVEWLVLVVVVSVGEAAVADISLVVNIVIPVRKFLQFTCIYVHI